MSRCLASLMTGIISPTLGSTPWPVLNGLAYLIGQGAYYLVPRRRKAALDNLRRFYSGERTPRDLRVVARRSSANLALVVIENIRFRHFFADGKAAAGFPDSWIEGSASL